MFKVSRDNAEVNSNMILFKLKTCFKQKTCLKGELVAENDGPICTVFFIELAANMRRVSREYTFALFFDIAGISAVTVF
jgi:hypothetical protein